MNITKEILLNYIFTNSYKILMNYISPFIIIFCTMLFINRKKLKKNIDGIYTIFLISTLLVLFYTINKYIPELNLFNQFTISWLLSWYLCVLLKCPSVFAINLTIPKMIKIIKKIEFDMKLYDYIMKNNLADFCFIEHGLEKHYKITKRSIIILWSFNILGIQECYIYYPKGFSRVISLKRFLGKNHYNKFCFSLI